MASSPASSLTSDEPRGRNVRRAILVRGARTHNLKTISCVIPHRAITVITGVSGSGKSSLAFDTLYAEGQRRYVESMSSYARQFLERIEKPDVEAIEHILPAIALEQKNRVRNARSTVGTATEILDYLRLLFAALGRGVEPTGDEWRAVADMPALLAALRALPAKTRLTLLAPIAPERRQESPLWTHALREAGYFRLWRDGEIHELDACADAPRPDETALAVIDRLSLTPEQAGYRLEESIANALKTGQNRCVALRADTGEWLRFELRERPALTAHHFSFNHPFGACAACQGFGRIIGLDMDKVIPNRALSLAEGAVHPFTTPANAELQDLLLKAARKAKIPLDAPYETLSDTQKSLVINGKGDYPGARAFFEWLETKRYKVHVRVTLARYRGYYDCPECLGSRLRADALAVRLCGEDETPADAPSIHDLSKRSVRALLAWFEAFSARISSRQREAAERPLSEIVNRLRYLDSVGLHYLTLDRQMRTLSGGEAQRIHLSAALGSALTDTLYVLDEPTVGLHARDTERLLTVMTALRDNGNTLAIVEHDPDVMRAADHLLDLGPSGGDEGGYIMYEGDWPGLLAAAQSQTGQWLTRRQTRESRRLSASVWRPEDEGPAIEIIGATGHNLRDLSVRLPLNRLVCVSGVSGSGKSSLITGALYTGYRHQRGESLELDAVACRELRGLTRFRDLILADQSPPARSMRSNPVTLMKAFDEIRKLFAASRKAKVLGLTPGDFSFNAAGGRCEKCEGLGVITVDMQFMADVTMRCPECQGRRYQRRVLSVDLFGRAIDDVLGMTVSEAIAFFKTAPAIRNRLKPLLDIGLGYLGLGQSTATLSGGEAQRLKLATYLKAEGRASVGDPLLFLFDEPTTGLHLSDIETLVSVMRRLLDDGHSVIAIEHNLDFIAHADHVLDLGPDGGEEGGQIVYQGDLTGLQACEQSVTGAYLRKSTARAAH